MSTQTTIDDILESFEFFDGWEERFRFVIDLGKNLAPMDDALKTDGTKVDGCMSQVWMLGRMGLDDGGAPVMRFVADSDAIIVRGLIAVLLAIYDAKSPAAILAVDIEAIFGQLGFGNHVSVNRRNGFFSMVNRIKSLAQANL